MMAPDKTPIDFAERIVIAREGEIACVGRGNENGTSRLSADKYDVPYFPTAPTCHR
jgi:hypothetical protein